MDSITITIPVPGRVLSPNGRVHWRAKAKAKKAQRFHGEVGCILKHAKDLNWPAASVQVLWFSKTANGLRMDHDNIIGSLKGAIDGLVDARLLTDDRGVTWLPPRVEVDKKNPRVELVVTKTNGAPDER